MSLTIINQVAFLRTSRDFPKDPERLTMELEKAYIDTANAINDRTIGLFPTNRPAITGEAFYLIRNQKQQTLRQVYTFTSTANIPHTIPNVIPGQFTKCTGSYTDGTNTYGIIFGTTVAIAGQISFHVTSTNIVFHVGAGAPALTSGLVILEWLANR